MSAPSTANARSATTGARTRSFRIDIVAASLWRRPLRGDLRSSKTARTHDATEPLPEEFRLPTTVSGSSASRPIGLIVFFSLKESLLVLIDVTVERSARKSAGRDQRERRGVRASD